MSLIMDRTIHIYRSTIGEMYMGLLAKNVGWINSINAIRSLILLDLLLHLIWTSRLALIMHQDATTGQGASDL